MGAGGGQAVLCGWMGRGSRRGIKLYFDFHNRQLVITSSVAPTIPDGRVGDSHIMMSHGLHESWQGRCRESFRIHGQLASANVGDSCYFLGSADVGRSRRCFSDISLNSKSQRKLDKYMRCNDWNIIHETIRAQGLANAHI